jgi:hypothetical protein
VAGADPEQLSVALQMLPMLEGVGRQPRQLGVDIKFIRRQKRTSCRASSGPVDQDDRCAFVARSSSNLDRQ